MDTELTVAQWKHLDETLSNLSITDNDTYCSVLSMAYQVVFVPDGRDRDQIVPDDYVLYTAGLDESVYCSVDIVAWDRIRTQTADAVELDGHIADVVELAA